MMLGSGNRERLRLAPLAPLFAFLIRTTLVSLPVALATGHFIRAQESQTPGAIEETVVTAQRIEEAIQDVPLSVAVFTGEELELRDVQRVADLVTKIPNVQVTGSPIQGSNGGQFTIRGIPDVLHLSVSR